MPKKLAALFFTLAILLLAFSSFIPQAHAQTTNYNIPNTDTNVPVNQHYFAQSVLIEMSSAIICQLIGIDPVNPHIPCLSINPVTNKLGFVTPIQGSGTPKIGGIVGFMSTSMAGFYQQPVSTGAYLSYLSDNFGIVKKAEAATNACPSNNNGYGFCSLQPLMKFWLASRDFSYFLFVIAFMLIGLGIMLRIKIDPRTVMTIQNQIPRIIICVLLITFSYAIAALMIDAMWLVTYVGINELAAISPDPNIASAVTPNLLFTPISFADKLFAYGKNVNAPGGHGLLPLTWNISAAMGGLVEGIAASVLGLNPANTNCSISFTGVNWQGCLNATFLGITTIVMLVVIFVTLIMTLFKLWFELLKAYTFTLLYVIAAPLWIVWGLLPGKPLGFEKWLRSLFVNLATFPVVALMIMLAKIFMDIFNGNGVTIDPNTNFIPPLVGDPNMKNFGVLIAFGILLMTPTILSMLRESMKVPGSKHGSAIASGLAAGSAVPGAVAGRAVANLNKRDQHGNALGPIARLQDTTLNKGANVAAQFLPFMKGVASRSNFQREKGSHAAASPEQYRNWQKGQKQKEVNDLHEQQQGLQRGGKQKRADKIGKRIDKTVQKHQLQHPDPRKQPPHNPNNHTNDGETGGTQVINPNPPSTPQGGASIPAQTKTSPRPRKTN